MLSHRLLLELIQRFGPSPQIRYRQGLSIDLNSPILLTGIAEPRNRKSRSFLTFQAINGIVHDYYGDRYKTFGYGDQSLLYSISKLITFSIKYKLNRARADEEKFSQLFGELLLGIDRSCFIFIWRD